MRSRIWTALSGIVLGAAIWIDCATLLDLHVFGGLPRQLLLFGEAVGILMVPFALWLAVKPHRSRPEGDDDTLSAHRKSRHVPSWFLIPRGR